VNENIPRKEKRDCEGYQDEENPTTWMNVTGPKPDYRRDINARSGDESSLGVVSRGKNDSAEGHTAR